MCGYSSLNLATAIRFYSYYLETQVGSAATLQIYMIIYLFDEEASFIY